MYKRQLFNLNNSGEFILQDDPVLFRYGSNLLVTSIASLHATSWKFQQWSTEIFPTDNKNFYANFNISSPNSNIDITLKQAWLGGSKPISMKLVDKLIDATATTVTASPCFKIGELGYYVGLKAGSFTDSTGATNEKAGIYYILSDNTISKFIGSFSETVFTFYATNIVSDDKLIDISDGVNNRNNIAWFDCYASLVHEQLEYEFLFNNNNLLFNPDTHLEIGTQARIAMRQVEGDRYYITAELQNVTADNLPVYLEERDIWQINLTAITGYNLPDTIIVKNCSYAYLKQTDTTGVLLINTPTDNISINIIGI